ncbi:SH3 domain protein [Vibrio astriarenae]|nr:SH3 domain protein [Vibrio sp. C7]
MKKLLMIFLLLLGVACAAGGYYLFIYKNDEVPDAPIEEVVELEIAEIEVQQPILDLEAEKPRIKEYYVAEPRIGVRESRVQEAFVERELFRGEKVVVLEEKDGWGRISSYFVYQEGGDEVAEWVQLSELQEQPPEISKKERYETVKLSIQGSDDFLLYQEPFTKYSDQSLSRKPVTCLISKKAVAGCVQSTTQTDKSICLLRWFTPCRQSLPRCSLWRYLLSIDLTE